MGSGIAQVSAQAGFDTILYELNEAVLQKARVSIAKSLDSLVEKGKIDASFKEQVIERIQFTSDIKACKADLVIEAIIENAQAKINLLNELLKLNAVDTIYASNTSSLSITSIAKQTHAPGRIIGVHFFNPAPIMKLVEVVNTEFVQQSVTQKISDVVKKMGKTAVVCQDSPGFIVNRIARPYYIESLRLVEKGLISFEKIDLLLESSGFKMGPFKLMDLIGNDINYAVSASVYQQLGEPERLRPSAIQKDKVDKGELGRKSGKGYYEYG